MFKRGLLVLLISLLALVSCTLQDSTGKATVEVKSYDASDFLVPLEETEKEREDLKNELFELLND